VARNGLAILLGRNHIMEKRVSRNVID
jgi:hypothetical protein